MHPERRYVNPGRDIFLFRVFIDGFFLVFPEIFVL